MPNVELLQRTMQHIKDHPEHHDQSVWACGTVACFAGRAALMSGWTWSEIDHTDMWVEGADLVGIDDDAALVLFHCHNTIPMLELMVKDLVNGDELRARSHYEEQVRP